MSDKENQGTLIIGTFTAIGTAATGIVGTALAAPAAIGAGIGLAIWGIIELVKDNKKK